MRDKYCQVKKGSVNYSAENYKRNLGVQCVGKSANQPFLRRDLSIVPIKT